MVTAYIGIGSNLGHPVEQTRDAVAAMAHIPQSRLLACSGLYSSRPMGPQDQPDYMNAVAAIETGLDVEQLLKALQQIELNEGRTREGKRWGPRTLDLDILLYGNAIIETPQLTIPHYGMKQREFVLIPLFEIAPNLTLPCQTTLRSLADTIPANGLERAFSTSQWLDQTL